MNGCNRVRKIIHSWESGESVRDEELSFLRGHAESCARCSRMIQGILPFMERDALGERPPQGAGPSEGFTDAVMERISGERPAKRRAVPYALAAAAVLLLAAGIGFFAFRAGAAGRTDEVLVHFELAAPEAKNVALVGSFTQWEPARLEMKDVNGDGVWEVSVRLKKGAVYTYNFLIDGTQWVPDPEAPAQVDDGFGGLSSVMQL